MIRISSASSNKHLGSCIEAEELAIEPQNERCRSLVPCCCIVSFARD